LLIDDTARKVFPKLIVGCGLFVCLFVYDCFYM
jgi:hypothetical protein